MTAATSGWREGCRRVIPLLVLLALAAGLRLAALGRHGFWQDEIHSIYLADDVTRVADPLMAHAPLYYLLLSRWQELGHSEGWIRGLSVVLGLLVLLVLHRITGGEFGRPVALYAVFLAAVSPVAIWAAREARGYVLLHLLALLAFGALLRARRTGEPGAFLLHGLAVAGALYTHYYAVFLVPAFGCMALLPAPVPRRRLVLGFLGATVLAGLLFLPWLPKFLESESSLSGYAREVNRFATGRSYFLKTLLYLLARTDPPHMLGAAAETLFPPRSFTALSLLALLVLVALLSRRLATEGWNSALLPWLALALVPSGLAVLGHYLRDVIIGTRYVAFASLFLAVPTATLVQGLGTTLRRTLLLSLLALGVLGAWPLYARAPSEIREAVRFIDAESRQGDCVATLANKTFIYRFYSLQGLPAVDLPWEVPGISRRVTPATPLAERAIREEDLPAILAYFRSCHNTWVLYNEEIMWGVDMGASRLRGALRDKGLSLVAHRSFSDTDVEAYYTEAQP